MILGARISPSRTTSSVSMADTRATSRRRIATSSGLNRSGKTRNPSRSYWSRWAWVSFIADLRLRRLGAALRLELALGRGREFGQLVGRPDRSAHQLAAAVRALAAEHRVGACAAERAFERADPRLGRSRRQIAIAALAIGAK